ncbi:MAG: FliA/WhiG family RNA polymerase sigma factor [Sphingopyxis sp.]|nr:FliA/WhiG family RNA polymerase sigma factor [Sphingopyxis sp.]
MKNETMDQFSSAPVANGRPVGYATAPSDLVRTHQALVRKLAWLVYGRAARSIELDDLVQVGMMALIEASRTYQDQGHSFATYATIRVRGAMVDHVRREAPLGRAAVSAARQLGQARQRLEQNLHRAPVTSEIAAELGMDPSDFLAFEQLGSRAAPVSLDEPDGPAAFLADIGQIGADDATERSDLVARLSKFLATLNPREQLVLQLFFHEELNLAEIGAVLEISAARVCQIKAAALTKLSTRMQQAT